eukprot:13768092-Alexandrium_andersonii.AAC.1
MSLLGLLLLRWPALVGRKASRLRALLGARVSPWRASAIRRSELARARAGAVASSRGPAPPTPL